MRHIHKITLVHSLFFLSFISIVFLCYSESEAKVRGMCANCHTMHNSQDGVSMVITSIPTAGGGDLDCTGCHSEPRENLLRLDCIGCHAMDLNGTALPEWGGIGSDYYVPQVYYNEVAGKSLAAGNFYYVSIDDAHGHNIHGFYPLIQEDFVQLDVNVPPGYVEAMDPSSVKYNTWDSNSVPEQILCAGAFGCHGNRNEKSQTKSMQGSHHGDDSVLQFGSIDQNNQGASLATSYRFLSGVLGGEASDWEWDAIPADHNEYYGKELTAVRTSQSSVASMSEFCASCHGNFHQYTGVVGDDGIRSSASAIVNPYTSAGGMSPWIRHPTDLELPANGEYAGYVSYNLTAPIARTSIPASASSDPRSDGKAIVFCLSCHRGHASRYWDSLRFSYGEMTTGNAGQGSGEGCFACHSDKDGI